MNLINKGDIVYVRATDALTGVPRYLTCEVVAIHDDMLWVCLPDDGPRLINRVHVLTKHDVDQMIARFIREPGEEC